MLAPYGITVRRRGGENMINVFNKKIENTEDLAIKEWYMKEIEQVKKIMEEDKNLTDEEVWKKYENDYDY
ncbi:MAG: hypothetical protein FWH46_05430 [Methanimicrococcus sp.]|nr:hypothetical protein [Methanimicrococcus sp.]